jgi:hypothetical protein
MKREQAVRINDHLLKACAAFEQARMTIAGLGKAPRIKFGDLLDEVVVDLQEKLLERNAARVRGDHGTIEGAVRF